MNVMSKILYKGLIVAGDIMQKEFFYDTINAFKVNRDLLFNILTKNKNTEYGKTHKFNSIKTVDDYKKNVPLNDYNNFKKYIMRELKGENNILTKEEVEYFGHSSGTTGSQKILPITKSSRKTMIKLNGVLCQKFVYDCFKNDWTYGKGVMLVDLNPGCNLKGKKNITSASSGGMSKIKSIVDYVWTSPSCVMELEDKDAAFYLHVLFALKEKNLMYIGGMFISSILDFFRFIEKNSLKLITDLKLGEINETINIDNKNRLILNKQLGDCSERSLELEREFNKGFNNIAKRIWPNILYIGSVTGANFSNYNDIVNKYTGNLPICSIAYAATEGFIGVNPYSDKVEYIVIPGTCFYEFIHKDDIDKKNPKTYLINELKINNDYEIVLTNFNGLYRYRLGDVVRVCGYYNKSPKIIFLYRKNQLLNMVSEKTTENHVTSALQKIVKEFNFNLVDYTTYADNSITPGRYIIYIEIENYYSKEGLFMLESKLDLELQNANLAYKRFRQRNRLRKLKVKLLKRGTFSKYKKYLLDKSDSANQIKIPRVLYDKRIIENL